MMQHTVVVLFLRRGRESEALDSCVPGGTQGPWRQTGCMTAWDERFRTGEYPSDPAPSPVRREYVDETSNGRALDQSIEGLRTTRENAEKQAVGDRISLIQADAR